MFCRLKFAKRLSITFDCVDILAFSAAIELNSNGNDWGLANLVARNPGVLIAIVAAYRKQHGKKPVKWKQLAKQTRLNESPLRELASIESSPSQNEASSFGHSAWTERRPRKALKRYLVSHSNSRKRARRWVQRNVSTRLIRSLKKRILASDYESCFEVILSGVRRTLDQEDSQIDSSTCKSESAIGSIICQPVSSEIDTESIEFRNLLHLEKMKSLRLLAYGASHEINNPLANIAMRAETLARREEAPDRKKKLEIIRQQAMRAHHMISDLMLFANPPKIQREVFDLPPLFEMLGAEYANELATRSIEFETRNDVIGMRLNADPKQLGEAIRALIDNSIESIGKEGAIVLRCSVDSANNALISVSDTGQGISDEILPSIFDPFFSGREAGRGLGFGLSKAWRIAREHGGDLRCINSQPGQTAFLLSLPGNRESRPDDRIHAA
ncbi:MAG: HAMP domain-containing sensor histidine kinase [Pirellulaceae bacterium]